MAAEKNVIPKILVLPVDHYRGVFSASQSFLLSLKLAMRVYNHTHVCFILSFSMKLKSKESDFRANLRKKYCQALLF
jgi:hypothetical protein